jgi:phosphatidylserine/phosphatidylglycerophosphate/cardiolipin synthase-like enzyme
MALNMPFILHFLFFIFNLDTEKQNKDYHISISITQSLFEIVIASPWIKRQPWERLKGPLSRFSRRGGRLKVFLRGNDSYYAIGLSDNMQEEISRLGGEMVTVSGLHAKIYMAYRREAIVASANLTKGGTEANIESGIWISDPAVLKEICAFIDGISPGPERCA